MQLRKMCRGMWKIYALLDVPKELRRYTLSASSSLSNGDEVPCVLLPYDEGHRIVELSVLSVSQVLTVVACDASGNVIHTVRRTVGPRIAKLSSQVHTFFKDREMERVRNFDAAPLFSQYEVSILKIMPYDDGIDTIHCSGCCVSDDTSALQGDVALQIVDETGSSVLLNEPIVLRDVCERVPRAEGCFARTVQFSARVPSSVGSLCLWVHPKEKENPALGGIRAINGEPLEDWRRSWREETRPAGSDERYTEEFREKWAPSDRELSLQRRTKLSVSPKFSIIVPLFNTPLPYLDEMIESVLGQSYGCLELILVNASPQNKELTCAVADWQKHDQRIVVVELQQNEGISGNTNAGIQKASGDFLCFLDHDDVLSLDALFCYAKALEDYPETDMFYSDEDHLENGYHKHVYFKPDWQPDLLLGMNYICHFLAVRKSVVDGLELATSEFDGAQDHYLALAVSEVARNVFHCRRVLYHWRIHEGSTASSIDQKPYAVEAGRLAIQSHLDRCDIPARAVHSERMTWRYEVEYDWDDRPLVSVIIPNKDAVPMLKRCLSSIRDKTDYPNYEIIVIENNSVDEEIFQYYEQVQEEDSRVRVVHYEGSFNYAKINNYGASLAKGSYLLLLNNDTEVISPNWMSRMVDLCMRDSTGIVGVKLLFPDGTIQHAGVLAEEGGPTHVNSYLPADCPRETIQLMQDMSAVTAACLMVKRSVFDEVEGLDTQFAVDYNDVDFCWRVRAAGYLVVYDPSVVLLHYESVSRGFHTSDESMLRWHRERGKLRKRWPNMFAFADPAGNPNYDQYNDNYYRLGN